MQNISYARYRFSPVIIQHAVWLYYRFPLSYRDVEDLLAERGIDVSYETVRRWALKFGQAYARRLRTTRPRPDAKWHLDEVFVSIAGKRMYLWCAVDGEGEVLDNPGLVAQKQEGSAQNDAQIVEKERLCPCYLRHRQTTILRCCSEGFGPYQAP